MRSTPEWTVYDRDGGYQAACKEVQAAAACLGLYPGGTIRHGHKHIVWTDTRDGDTAEDYDLVAQVAYQRLAAIRRFLLASGTRLTGAR